MRSAECGEVMTTTTIVSAQDALNYAAPRWLPGGNCRRSGRSCMRGVWRGYRCLTGVSAGPRQMRISLMSTMSKTALCRVCSGPCWWSFTAWRIFSKSLWRGLCRCRTRAGLGLRAAAFSCFRSGEINRAPRAYHSGDYAEIGWMLERFQAGPSWAADGSGGLAGEAMPCCAGPERPVRVGAGQRGCSGRGVRALDLAASGRAIGQGFNRQLYTRMFMRTLIPKALQKLAQYPDFLTATPC